MVALSFNERYTVFRAEITVSRAFPCSKPFLYIPIFILHESHFLPKNGFFFCKKRELTVYYPVVLLVRGKRSTLNLSI